MENSIIEKIAVRLKELRIAKGYTQNALYFRTGVNRTFIGHIETARKNVSIETLERLLEGLGCDFQEFFSAPEFSKNGQKVTVDLKIGERMNDIRPVDQYTNRTREKIIQELESKEV